MPDVKNKLFLETTEVPAAKSIGEITAVLVKAGAREISTTYENGEPAGVRWAMWLYDRLVWFRMPVRINPVYKVLRSRRIGTGDRALREMARRVAWRQLLMWTKVQLAMVELDMAEFAQVFFPYLLTNEEGVTAWDVFKGTQLALPAPEKPPQ